MSLALSAARKSSDRYQEVADPKLSTQGLARGLKTRPHRLRANQIIVAVPARDRQRPARRHDPKLFPRRSCDESRLLLLTLAQFHPSGRRRLPEEQSVRECRKFYITRCDAGFSS